jgi:hypothetical protein
VSIPLKYCRDLIRAISLSLTRHNADIMIAAVSLTYDKKRDSFTVDDVLKEIKELFGIQNYWPGYVKRSFKYVLKNTNILEKVGEDRFRLHPQYKSEIDKKLQKQQVKEM